MSDLHFQSAEALGTLIRRREISPLELMRDTLARIDALNPVINAFVALDPERSLAEADAQTERLARGEDLGPLAGLPIGVKDLENATPFKTTFGSTVFKENVPDRDDVHVERLRRAGAIVIGKTNTPNFGMGGAGNTENALFGYSRNPWDPQRSTGGSSGGSAAAVASGMVPFATGSDSGGSIRLPSALCGIFGVKPSFGRVPVGPDPILPWVDTNVYGPMTRTVGDAALFLDQVAGYHPADPSSLPHPGYSFHERLREPLPRLRIAFSRTLGQTRLQPDIEREATAAVAAFANLGHEIVEYDEPIPDLTPVWLSLVNFQRLVTLWDEYNARRGDFDPKFAAMLDNARNVGATQFHEIYATRAAVNEWTWRLFDTCDLLLTPMMAIEAWELPGGMPTTLDGEPRHPAPFSLPFNSTGHPAACVRAGYTDSGMPCGLQIVGPRHRDDLVLQAAAAYETARPWADRWPVCEFPANAGGAPQGAPGDPPR
jgi:aspartyl-tRNA(Asn)/glutamyl-tRNA(Gln) amidotransferase subunit A